MICLQQFKTVAAHSFGKCINISGIVDLKTEHSIFEMYLDGKSGKDIIESMGIKESTLKFHNSNIYEKLGVSSRKQMLRYATLYMNENGGKIS